jgi:flagellar basal-body rod modification protein FlgD
MQTTLSTTTQNNSVSNTASPASATAGADADLFTKLLVAQIKNQNPLEPTDPTEFVRQLTQQSQMQALQKLADQSAATATMLSSIQLLALGAQVGSQLTVQSDKVALSGKPVQVGFTLENINTSNTLVLTGVDGSEHRIELGSQSAGNVQYTVDPVALGLPNGSYSMQVMTSSKESPKLNVTGTLNSVQLAGGGSALLNVTGAGQVQPNLIISFNGHP